MPTWLVVLLVALAAVAVTAAAAVWFLERWLRAAGLGRVRTQLGTLLQVDEVDVDIEASRLWRAVLVDRHLRQVRLRAAGVPVRDGRAELAQLDVALEDVRLQGRLRTPTLVVGAGRFRARIDEEQLSRLIDLPPFIVRVSVDRRGVRLHTIAGMPVAAKLSVRQGQVVVTPTSPVRMGLLPRPGLVFALPELPAGAVVEQLALGDGYLVATGPVAPDDIVAGRR